MGFLRKEKPAVEAQIPPSQHNCASSASMLAPLPPHLKIGPPHTRTVSDLRCLSLICCSWTSGQKQRLLCVSDHLDLNVTGSTRLSKTSFMQRLLAVLLGTASHKVGYRVCEYVCVRVCVGPCNEQWYLSLSPLSLSEMTRYLFISLLSSVILKTPHKAQIVIWALIARKSNNEEYRQRAVMKSSYEPWR